MNFKEALNKLNDAQRQAVKTIEGPVMVIAGPGTGKTQVLTLRIANILQETDTEAENILAITFTESGVASMRKRLSQLIGSAAYYVNISTFHAFANSVIYEYPEEFPHIIGARSITEIEQIQILEKIILGSKLKVLKPFGDPFYYLKAILSSINSLKREDVGPKDLKKIIQEETKTFEGIEDLHHAKGAHKGKMKGHYQRELKGIDKNRELAELYEKYQKTLREKGVYDYSDMIMEVLRVLKSNEDLLYQLQEKHQYLLVDEHQDTNNAQNKILELLASFHKNPNVFVVGDEKQAIFRFQGASLENFLYFQKLYPQAKLIKLVDNYRSTQTILNAAHNIKQSSINPSVKLKAKSLHPEKHIDLAILKSLDTESYFIGRTIKKKIANGADAGEIAVLYRDNKDALAISHMLEKLGISFTIESDQNIFFDEDIKKLITLLKAIDNFGSEDILAQVMHADFLGIAPFDIYRALHHSRKEKGNSALLAIIKNTDLLEKLELQSAPQMYQLYKNLSKWKAQAHFKNLTELFEEIVRDSGFLAHILSKNEADEKLDKLNALFNEIKNLVQSHKEYTLAHFVEYLNLLEEHNLLVKRATKKRSGKVRLMTAHKSKGQEFNTVFIVNAFDGHWGSRRNREKIKLPAKVFSLLAEGNFDSELDERNLFYVALTRARKEAIISYSEKGEEDKDQLPAQYIGEINEKYLNNLDLKDLEVDFEKNKTILFNPSISSGRAINVSEKAFLNDLFKERGLSVTALNNYLRCPWEYFFKNLIRIPEAKKKYLMYGSAVHKALEMLSKSLEEGKNLSKTTLLKHFKEALEKEALNKADFQEVLERGETALSGYFDKYKDSFKNEALYELNIKNVQLGDINLNGKLDKVELLEKDAVNVVDYKTGKFKTRNEILGKTKNSDGGIYRQLVFYKLLLNKYKDGKYRLQTGVIDFVEPEERGRYRREEFTISDSEVKELEQEIQRVAKEILDLSFWSKKCGEKDCEYCELSKTLSP